MKISKNIHKYAKSDYESLIYVMCMIPITKLALCIFLFHESARIYILKKEKKKRNNKLREQKTMSSVSKASYVILENNNKI
jgi:hypothetical protein